MTALGQEQLQLGSLAHAISAVGIWRRRLRARGPGAAEPRQNSTTEQDETWNSKISLGQLERLRGVFYAQGPIPALDENGFVAAMEEILEQRLTERQLRTWFMQVDANADGRVDWDEFSSFILAEAEQQMLDEDAKQSYAYQHHPVDTTPNALHTAPITRLVIHPRYKRYYTGSQDGTVKVWSDRVKYHSTLHAGDGWITDLCFTPLGHRLLVATVDRMVCVYDPARGELVRVLTGAQMTPDLEEKIRVMRRTAEERGPVSTTALAELSETLAEFHLRREKHDASLRRTDVTHCPDMREAVTALDTFGDEHNIKTLVGDKTGRLLLYDLSTPARGELSTIANVDIHRSGITRVRYAPYLDCAITASWDSRLGLIDLTAGQVVRKLGGDSHQPGHKLGIHGFDWSESRKVIASCSSETFVCLWNHCIPTPVFVLPHTQQVVDVVCNEPDQQLVTLSADRTIRIFDMRTFHCVQTIRVKKSRATGLAPVTAMSFDRRGQRLVVGSIHPIVYPMKKALSKFPATYHGHQLPALNVAINKEFQHAVSVDAKRVIVWDITSGDVVSSFGWRTAHSDVLCFCLDGNSRRIFLGSTTGESLPVFNSITGQVLRTFVVPTSGEISALAYAVHDVALQQRLVFGICGPLVHVWHDTPDGADLPIHTIRPHAPAERFTALCFVPPSTLALGTNVGTVLLFHTLLYTELVTVGEPNNVGVSVECLLHAPRQHLLLSGRGDGFTDVWCVATRDHWLLRVCGPEQSLYCMACDDHGLLATNGQQVGQMLLWTLKRGMDDVKIELRSTVQAHPRAITCIRVFSEPHELILTAADDCCIRVWTKKAELIGFFGQGLKWQLGLRSSYQLTASTSRTNVVQVPTDSYNEWHRKKAKFGAILAVSKRLGNTSQALSNVKICDAAPTPTSLVEDAPPEGRVPNEECQNASDVFLTDLVRVGSLSKLPREETSEPDDGRSNSVSPADTPVPEAPLLARRRSVRPTRYQLEEHSPTITVRCTAALPSYSPAAVPPLPLNTAAVPGSRILNDAPVVLNAKRLPRKEGTGRRRNPFYPVAHFPKAADVEQQEAASGPCAVQTAEPETERIALKETEADQASTTQSETSPTLPGSPVTISDSSSVFNSPFTTSPRHTYRTRHTQSAPPKFEPVSPQPGGTPKKLGMGIVHLPISPASPLPQPRFLARHLQRRHPLVVSVGVGNTEDQRLPAVETTGPEHSSSPGRLRVTPRQTRANVVSLELKPKPPHR
eukprot:TRINITY_DN9469_c0_g1_i1.p1 TRINITY_DN9469_c0_g1~~TRINITY_DN9469_c0_g1_i1.p1  ORF type:complete len:1266 (+),score=137.45 TRINITY_DN9469_c0_g1_i1:65-3799(+)